MGGAGPMTAEFQRRGHPEKRFGYIPDRRHLMGLAPRKDAAKLLGSLPVPTVNGGSDEPAGQGARSSRPGAARPIAWRTRGPTRSATASCGTDSPAEAALAALADVHDARRGGRR